MYQFEDFISFDQLEDLKKAIGFNKIKWDKKAIVYDSKKGKNVMNDKRDSYIVSLTDDAIFDYIDENLIAPLNEKFLQEPDATNFMLLREDIRIIKYIEGGKFDWHTDYDRMYHKKSYTFLLNIEGCKKGGATWIDYKAYEEIGQKPGTVLIFEKDKSHKGSEVEEGVKILLKVTLIPIYVNEVYTDHLFIELPKEESKWVRIGVNKLYKCQHSFKKYLEYYKTEKIKYPEKRSFVHREDKIDVREFFNFYNTLDIKEITKPPTLLQKTGVMGYRQGFDIKVDGDMPTGDGIKDGSFCDPESEDGLEDMAFYGPYSLFD